MENDSSPYKPPKSPIEVNGNIPLEVKPAGKWRRFFNLLVDYVAFIVYAAIIGVGIGLVFGDEGIAMLESAPDIVTGSIIVFSYYIFLESLFGRTVGKFVTGTKVVNEAGLKPSFGQIIGRSISRIIPFEIFSFLGAEGRGWHDSIPNTYVVMCR
jgi:uncharacterized RDD family membrane protein YckC